MEKRNIHILLADDDPMMLRLFGSKLARAGFEVLPAHNLNEAREMARRLKPDLILLDYRMDGTIPHNPDRTSLVLLNVLKTEEQTKQIPVIIFTNEDLSIEAEKWLKDSGVDDYIHKGTITEELVDRINNVLKKSKHKNIANTDEEVVAKSGK